MQTHKLILIMVAAFVIITIFILIWDKWSNPLWKGRGQYKKRPRYLDSFYSSTYRFLKSFPLTRNYIEKLGYPYRLICSCDSKLISKRTVSSCLISWCICIFSFVIIYIFNPRLITLITAGVAIVLADLEVVGRMAKSFEIRVLHETQRMISNVVHFYYVAYRVDDALYHSMESLSLEMKQAASDIYELLLSDNREEALRVYYENVPNKYLRAFVNQCVGVMERGDQTIDGKFLFIRNMENLQREIDIEIDKLERLRMEFLGVIFFVVAPVFCIDFVKKFAISMKENMESFFYGKEGFLLDIGLLTIIVCIYFIMSKSAEYRSYPRGSYKLLLIVDKIPLIHKAMDNYCDKNASRMERLKRELRNNGSNIRPRHFVLQSFLLAGLVFVLGICTSLYLHEVSKEKLLIASEVDMELLTSAAKDSQYKAMSEVVETYTRGYLFEDRTLSCTQEEIVSHLTKEGLFFNTIINEALAEEILRRVNAYKQEHFTLINLIFVLSLSFIAYYIPKVILKYNATVSKDAMEDEVNQFNALICMLMYIDSMTVKQILEEMETFAVVYKQSLRICIDNYGSGDVEALIGLKEREPYEPFKRIVDNLLRCDDMAIYEAFHEVDVERDGYMAKRKRINEISIRKRVFRAYLLAAVPLLLLFAYGLVPTLLSSIKEINMMLEELDSTSW